MKALIAWHRQRYPSMEAKDVVKAVFQAMCGCGHLLGKEAEVTRRIQEEMAALHPQADEPLTEPLGKDYVRMNLRRAMADSIRPEWIARLMAASENDASHPDRAEVSRVILALTSDITGCSPDELAKAAEPLLKDASWLPSHSEAYRTAYKPAYRVIKRSLVPMLPVLSALGDRWNKERLLVSIDGPCGSGKTTVASMLCPIVDAACVPMDHFFLPHGQKSEQRLAQPGGNADWERLLEEVLVPWQHGEEIAYRPYDCHLDRMLSPVHLPRKKVTVLEGSYSLLPPLSAHADIRVFLTIDEAEQQRRILARNGQAGLRQFVTRWIPLERAYFEFFSLPDERCVVLSTSSDQTV